MTASVKQIDCRGQQCPAPILTTTRAAKSLAPHGGTLQVLSDDDAFPKDIESWCRSTNAELVRVDKGEGHYAAVVSIPASLEARRAADADAVARPVAPALTLVRTEPEVDVVDCRGMMCPAPIVQVARVVRTRSPDRLRVIADDPAFRLDIATWSQSSGYQVAELSTHADGSLEALLTRGQAQAGEAAPSYVDVRGLVGPARIQAVAARVAQAGPERPTVDVLATDVSFVQEVVAWCGLTGHAMTRMEMRAEGVMVTLTASHARAVVAPPAPVAPTPTIPLAVVPDPVDSPAPKAMAQENICALLILHNDLEALLAAMLIANGALAQGMEVTIFFSFWGLNLLRGDRPNLAAPDKKVGWMQRMMKWMMPKGPKRQKLGQMNFAGAGKAMLGHIMKSQNIMDLPQLMASATEGGARFIACTMSMSVMGITERDLAPLPNLQFGGVATFVGDASRAKISMCF